MTRIFVRAADWAMKHRSKMPRWVGRMFESAARNPDGFIGQVSAKLLGGGAGDITEVPDSEIRVYIAPTNYAGQGYLWARELERASHRIQARNSAIKLPGDWGFNSDATVPIATVNGSASWGEAEWQAARQFTHVLVEAERPMFGKKFGRDVETEVLALEREGLSVAFLCHGIDVRSPELNAKLTPWSPYPEDPRTNILQSDVHKNLELLQRLNRPTFVSTPDLLLDVPLAKWCPVVVDVDRFSTDEPLLASPQPRIIHASSNPLQKGSHYIEPALAPLLANDSIRYQLIDSTPASEMPAVYASADIVLDQFRVGAYGTAACEAMAAGRVVIGHVLPQVREIIKDLTGLSLPIVEATPDTLFEVVQSLINDPEATKQIAASGPAYVATVHSGSASARTLIDKWILRAQS